VVGQTSVAGSAETRARLVNGAIEALREEGFAGASAREIARRSGCNQGLVFYHFGSVANLLLAALDEVSAMRLAHYQAAVDKSGGLSDLVEVAEMIFEEDLDAGHIAVLAEMISGAKSTPGLGPEVVARIAPWREFTSSALRSALMNTPLSALLPPEEIAHGVVALYLGLEMLAHLDGDRSKVLALFDKVRQMTALLGAFGGAPAQKDRR
jgi:AcrR family transcriptional regulator